MERNPPTFQSSNLPIFQSLKPMLFLVLNIILLSGFGLFLKHAKNNQQRLNPIGFVNYLTAFFISVWVLSQEQDFEFSKLTFALGISNGVTYAVGFELFTIGIRLSGIVVTGCACQAIDCDTDSGVNTVLARNSKRMANYWTTLDFCGDSVSQPTRKGTDLQIYTRQTRSESRLRVRRCYHDSACHRYLAAHHESLQ